MTYTVTDITELIRHHLVLSTDDTERPTSTCAADTQHRGHDLDGPVARAHLLDGVRGVRRLGLQRAVRARGCRRVRRRRVPVHGVPVRGEP